jgi:hypothetical protein
MIYIWEDVDILAGGRFSDNDDDRKFLILADYSYSDFYYVDLRTNIISLKFTKCELKIHLNEIRAIPMEIL